MKPLLQTVAKPIIDTIAKQVVVPQKPESETLEILSKVNEFYDSSWNKLLYVLGSAFAILAIVVPIVIQYIQNKAIEASEKELETKSNLKIDQIKKDLEEELEKKLDSKILEFKKDLETKIKKIDANTNASAFHMQGNDCLQKENYKEAVRDYCSASTNYQVAGDLVNLKATLSGFLYCVELLNKSDITYLENIESLKLFEILDQIEKEDIGGAFLRDIRKIRAAIYKIINSEEKQEENID